MCHRAELTCPLTAFRKHFRQAFPLMEDQFDYEIHIFASGISGHLLPAHFQQIVLAANSGIHDVILARKHLGNAMLVCQELAVIITLYRETTYLSRRNVTLTNRRQKTAEYSDAGEEQIQADRPQSTAPLVTVHSSTCISEIIKNGHGT